ncbi:hypothetical protein BS78_09G022700 [Paspalum vaginatum]|nr:hypothetical protein BS78_09G022700 [Paspalum vaginatum]
MPWATARSRPTTESIAAAMSSSAQAGAEDKVKLACGSGVQFKASDEVIEILKAHPPSRRMPRPQRSTTSGATRRYASSATASRRPDWWYRFSSPCSSYLNHH